MFAMDVPYVPTQAVQVITAQAEAGGATLPPDFILNECQETDHTKAPTSAFRGVDPAYMLKNYFSSISREIKLADIKTTMLQGTLHGKIFSEVDNTGITAYHYDPAPGFLGDDRAVFMAEYGGKRYKIIVNIKVMQTVDERSPVCPDPVMIKAPKPASGDSGFGTDYKLTSFTLRFGDLAGLAVGPTNGGGITLQ
jgi:hypothetical protein